VTARDPRPPRRAAAPALRAVLFDMDGLLVDSEPLWFVVEREVAERLGAPWGEADQEALIGGSLERTVSWLLAKAGGAAKAGRPATAGGPVTADGPVPAGREDVARWLVAGMARLVLARGLPLQPGAARLLAALDAAGVPCALVTASYRAIMDAVLKVTGLSFGVTVCGEDVQRGKPDPEPYLRAAALLGVPPAGCVVLEDSPTGIAAARAAGCPVIAVPSVPVSPGRGLITVKSLDEVGFELLQRAMTGNSAGRGHTMTEEF
jgi:HAD superfamily hydrolase (TIGR01509 family)